MRTAHATKDAAIAAARTETAFDGQERGVWYIKGDRSEVTGWTVPSRFIVGKTAAGAPMIGVPRVALIEGRA